MQRIAAAFNRFTYGEVSQLIIARDDLDKYEAGCQKVENFIPLLQGPLRRRGGTRFIAKAGNGLNPVALVDFTFSETTAYLLEIGDRYLRIFYRGEAVLDSTGSEPYSIGTPWTQADLFDENGVQLLKWVQSGDVMYLVCPGQPPQKLSRHGHIDWRLEKLPGWGSRPNAQCIAIFRERLVLAAGRSIYFSQSGAFENFGSEETGANNVAFFQPENPDQEDQYQGKFTVGEANKVLIYEQYQGNTFVIVTRVTVAFAAGEAIFNLSGSRMVSVSLAPGVEAFSEITFSSIGTPAFGGMVIDEENGVITMGTENLGALPATATFPTPITGALSEGTSAGAKTMTYAVNGSAAITADDPIEISLMHEALWMVPVDALAVGTAGDEYHIGETVSTEPFGPDNIKVTPETRYGSAPVQALRAGSTLMFVQRSGRKVRELVYNYASEAYSALDSTLAAEHITRPVDGSGGGLTALVWQAEPIETLWGVRSDGILIGLTFNSDQAMLAWHRHILGGGGKIRHIAVLPSAFGTDDEVYLCVEREINGEAVQYIERMERGYYEGEDQDKAFYVDCGITISGEGLTEVGGLEHLEGQTVQIVGDGAAKEPQTVSNGKVYLNYPADVVHVGLGYVSRVLTLPMNFVLQDGITHQRIKRFIGTQLRLIYSSGGFIGDGKGNMQKIEHRTNNMRMDTAVPLFTGDIYINWPGGYGLESNIEITNGEPLPMTIAAVYPVIAAGNA